jgi:tRNA(Ile)-lysidine synthase
MTLTQMFVLKCQEFQALHGIKRWVIALSGGLDSIVTLELAHRYLSDLPIVAVHVNHQQQTQANDWQAFCAEQCAKRNVGFHPYVINPAGSSEKVLRDSRYHCFESFVAEGDCLLFGHHGNDQAETMLFRLVRGAGLSGLSAMPESRKIAQGWLLRPLLSLAQQQLSDYAQQRLLAWVDDPSNLSLDYDRNFLRHKVVAALLEHWPHAAEKMAQSAQLLATDQQLLADYLAQDLEPLLVFNRKVSSLVQGMSIERWSALTKIKRIAVLRYWIASVLKRPVSHNELQKCLVDVIDSREDSQGFCQFGDYQLRRFKNHLFLLKDINIEKHWPSLKVQGKQYRLTHGQLVVSQVSAGVELDDRMYWQCNVPGLRIKGVNRPSKKLKQLFQETGIPPWQRAGWPILMYEDEVVAVPGICIAHQWFANSTGSNENKLLFSLDWQPM